MRWAWRQKKNPKPCQISMKFTLPIYAENLGEIGSVVAELQPYKFRSRGGVGHLFGTIYGMCNGTCPKHDLN